MVHLEIFFQTPPHYSYASIYPIPFSRLRYLYRPTYLTPWQGINTSQQCLLLILAPYAMYVQKNMVQTVTPTVYRVVSSKKFSKEANEARKLTDIYRTHSLLRLLQ